TGACHADSARWTLPPRLAVGGNETTVVGVEANRAARFEDDGVYSPHCANQAIFDTDPTRRLLLVGIGDIHPAIAAGGAAIEGLVEIGPTFARHEALVADGKAC